MDHPRGLCRAPWDGPPPQLYTFRLKASQFVPHSQIKPLKKRKVRASLPRSGKSFAMDGPKKGTSGPRKRQTMKDWGLRSRQEPHRRPTGRPRGQRASDERGNREDAPESQKIALALISEKWLLRTFCTSYAEQITAHIDQRGGVSRAQCKPCKGEWPTGQRGRQSPLVVRL